MVQKQTNYNGRSLNSNNCNGTDAINPKYPPLQQYLKYLTNLQKKSNISWINTFLFLLEKGHGISSPLHLLSTWPFFFSRRDWECREKVKIWLRIALLLVTRKNKNGYWALLDLCFSVCFCPKTDYQRDLLGTFGNALRKRKGNTWSLRDHL